MGTEIRALITQNLRFDWGSVLALKDCIIQRTYLHKRFLLRQSAIDTWGLFIVNLGLNVNMSTYITFQGSRETPNRRRAVF